jgi:predicted RNA-binding protein associated with RNAse of E/G family
MLPTGWDGGHEDAVWQGSPNLRLHQWGTAHAIIRSWNFTSRCAEGWYINLERAWRRTPIGFDSEDLVLDIMVALDLSSWAWKDEDELAWSVDVGKYSPAQAAAIRAEGLRVVHALETRAWPFSADWSAWRPNPLWPIPTVPEDWADASL